MVFGAVSRWDRLLIFAACNIAAAACFVICITLWMILATRPTKFAILYVPPFFIAFSFHHARRRLSFRVCIGG